MDEINSGGGLLDGSPMELLQFDDKNSQEEVGAIAEMIASDDSIAAVLGHFSSGVAMTAGQYIYGRRDTVVIRIRVTSRLFRHG